MLDLLRVRSVISVLVDSCAAHVHMHAVHVAAAARLCGKELGATTENVASGPQALLALQLLIMRRTRDAKERSERADSNILLPGSRYRYNCYLARTTTKR